MKLISLQRVMALSAALVFPSLVLLSSTTVFAQAGASDGDKHFVEAALKGGMAEVELGKMASEKGASEDVRQFGQKMVTDHTRLGDKMKTVAGEIGVTPPDATTAGDFAEKTELKVLSGKTFDDAYIKAMLKDHEHDLQDFKKEADTGTSPAVKRAAHQGEAVVASHLEMIRKIAQAHNVTASNQKPSPSTLASAVGGR